MKKNKQFIITMFITATIGLATLMIFMFIGIKYFTENKAQEVEVIQLTKLEQPKVHFHSLIVGVVEEKVGNELTIFDIEKRQTVKTTVHDLTEIKDERERAIPLESINVGAIVEISYEPAKDNLLAVNKCGKAWIKTGLKNVKIDKPSSKLSIGESSYEYTENLLILDQEGNKVDNIHFVGAYDTLELIGIENQVYSLRILEKQGFIEVRDLPTLKGRLEIDINRQINLEQIGGPITVSSGTHKIGIYLEGYEPFIKTINVAAGETVILTPDELEKTYYDLQIRVTNGDNQYVIDIDGKTYKPEDEIKVLPGEHLIEISKKGFKAWKQSIPILESGTLDVTLAPIEPEPAASLPEEIKEDELQIKIEDKSVVDYNINLNTEPVGAEVYINGQYRGITPYTTTLELGHYYIEFKKEGYKVYTTTLIVEYPDSQNSYLYTLIPKNE